MKISKSFYYSICLMALIGMAPLGMQGCQRAPKSEDPKFETADCAKVAPYATKKLPVPKGIEGAKCGYLVVPESRKKPKGPHIKLPVVIIPAATSPSAPDPVVFMAGGPGGSAWIEIDLLIESGVNRNRDLILMSQRGSLFAQPELMCPETDEQALMGLNFPLDSEAYKNLYLDAMRKCATRLRKLGIDLDAYNTTENAADFADLRKALGISQWNVFGVSYGSYLAQALMFQHPEGIRTVTLDSVIPLSEANIAANSARNASEAFKNIFAACIAQPACNARFPNLEQTVTNLVNQLEAKPVTTNVQVGSDTKPINVVVDGGAIVNAIIDTGFRKGEFVNLPSWIDDLANGKPEKIALARAIPASLPPNVLGYGMATSIVCSNYVAADNAEDILNSGRKYFPNYPDSVLAPSFHFTDILDVCHVWDVTKQPMNLHPYTSNIPTLLLSGTFDGVAPPNTGVTVSKSLTHATVQGIPGAGHGVVESSECAQKIFASFLSNPSSPDTSCAAEPPPDFKTGG